MSTTPESEIDAILDHILDVLCDDHSLLSTPEERGIAAVGYHNIDEAKAALSRLIDSEVRRARIDELSMMVCNRHYGEGYAEFFTELVNERMKELEAGSGEAKG